MYTATACLDGAGLGLRRELYPDLMAGVPDTIDFPELAPENWLEMDSARHRELCRLAEQRPIVVHGLSLHLGGQAPMDELFLLRVRQFLDRYDIAL